MRGMLRGLAAAVLVLGLTVQAGAASEREWRATPGGWVSGPLEYVDTVPFEAGSGVSAVLHGRHLYVTTFRSYSIYDVKNALKPVRLSTVPLGVQLFNEQPDTNGKILLLTADVGPLAHDLSTYDPAKDAAKPLRRALVVVDVQDKASPRTIASLTLTRREHIWTCVLDCRYAYGAGGAIVDLADPAKPALVGDWSPLVDPAPEPARVHTIEEVAPGRVVVGADPVFYLDARRDPTRPEVLAQMRPALTEPGAPSNPTSLPAHVAWPSQAKSRWLMMGMETPLGGRCDKTAGGFRTYDTSGWESTRTFTFADEYALTDDSDATYTNGRSVHHVWGCSAYAIDAPEHFDRSGQVAAAWFEDGVRLLQVDRRTGKIAEIGGFLPAGGSSATPLWRNDEVIYSIDLYRGIDILRVTPREPPRQRAEPTGSDGFPSRAPSSAAAREVSTALR
jgi:hypothetical protein